MPNREIMPMCMGTAVGQLDNFDRCICARGRANENEQLDRIDKLERMVRSLKKEVAELKLATGTVATEGKR